MFAKLIAVALALPLVSALTINTPTGATTGGTITITWSASTTDPTSFTLELTNTIFHNTFAIANTVTTSTGSITLQLPQVPVGDGYTVEAVANNNVNQVYAQSGDFSVGAQTSATSTSASTTSAATGSTTSTGTVSVVSAVSTTTAPASSGTAASSSTSASVTPSSFSNGAVSPFKFGLGVGPAAAVVLSAVAGAVMVF
ncbi:hypothetical protein PAXINDRAFT_157332 [Paxillus involutus ATCC 200175]|jgi:hypothetical protein|uniref:Yeast cell wall synthesis Kre9/Knh1-like N-terminal domain-containing protein n=1 Tax=Paxillus involutus ATCC 200175 TaxID=664439 RepID=A0A0C9SSK8_PAXIN|nr:hypothetical protein PAXINDRAFT_157332 [Paxillus involutus ATCC 200175]